MHIHYVEEGGISLIPAKRIAVVVDFMSILFTEVASPCIDALDRQEQTGWSLLNNP